jgi:putative SOS response-associated peptidase YedK
MCGRIVQANGPVRYRLVEGLDVPDNRLSNIPRRYNGAPSQELLVIRQNHKSGDYSLDLLKWGFVANHCREPKPKIKPINAKAETVAGSPLFAASYARRRCIVPVDGYFEWMATKDGKQPYAIAMKDGAPFALAGIWDNWKDPASGEWVRTFALLTVPANALVGRIHDRMPLILKADHYTRWLGPETDVRDLLASFPPEPMTMWPVSKRINSARDDDPALLEAIEVESTGPGTPQKLALL